MNQYQEVLPVHTYPSSMNGTRFMARPLPQWRKQYQSNLASNRRLSVGMPMDRPGSSSIDISSCTKCNRIKSNTSVSESEYKDTSSYLQSRCFTYEQNTSTKRINSIDYFNNEGIPIDPSNSPNGTQVYETRNCFINQNQNKQCNKTIYKPNNSVDLYIGISKKLKYNTLNNNGAVFNSASGALNINSGRYQTESSPSYYNKFKPQKVVFNRKTGSNNHCPSPSSLSSTDYSMCILE